jgi:phosphonate transport system permease protein
VEKQFNYARNRIVIKVISWLVLGGFFVYSFQAIVDFDWLSNPKRLEYFKRVVKALSNPNFQDAEIRQIAAAKMLETAQMGFLATTISAMLAIPFTFISARPASKWGHGFTIILQPILSAIRSIHPFYSSILAIIMVGLGPNAGMLALTLYSTAVLIGTFSEFAQEHKAINWLTLFKVYAPGMAFNQLPVNILIATIVGAVGGGGVGFVLQQSINLLQYRSAGVYFIACIITIGSIDLISRAVWRQIQKELQS